jgi:hypothetical protein
MQYTKIRPQESGLLMSSRLDTADVATILIGAR